MPSTAYAADSLGYPDADKTGQVICNVNCGGRCPLIVQVKDGTIVRCLPDQSGDDSAMETRNVRACLRGRTIRDRVYSPDRVKKPLLRRPGTKRGEGQWDEISWDEALDLFAEKLQSTIDTYGNDAVFYQGGSGALGCAISGGGPYQRLFNLMGGYLGVYGNYSYAQIATCTPMTYGPYQGRSDSNETPSNTFEDSVRSSELVVMFGNNPQETRMSGGGILMSSQQLNNKSVRTIVIDPMYSETALTLADQWIPIRPGTDTALVSALAYVIISEDLHDQEFLDKYVQGFDEDHMPEGVPENSSYKSYIMGDGPDGLPKTPEWASEITGIPADTIETLAREIGNAKPCAITQGWGPQRHANGENQARAIYALAIITGNVGIEGGGTGGRDGYNWRVDTPFPVTPNNVEAKIPVYMWPEAIRNGENMTATKHGVRGVDQLSTSIKFMFLYASNRLASQHGDINQLREIIQDESKCEFIVVADPMMTASAELADLILPDTLSPERWDVGHSEYPGEMGLYMFHEKMIEPPFEVRDSYDVSADLAERLGIGQEYTEGRTREDWAKFLVGETKKSYPEFPTWDELEEMKVYRYEDPDGPPIPLKKFRDDPEANPLETPSGKIELFSTTLWEWSQTWEFDSPRIDEKITPLPEYMDTPESAVEAKTNDKYPLQCIGHHYKGRTHSSFANQEWLKEIHPQMLWMNPRDAEKRGIENGDEVEIWNDRGTVRTKAHVTPRIMPGVLSLPQGSWYKRDSNGVDIGGAINTLASMHPTAYAKGNAQHTNLVEVKKVN